MTYRSRLKVITCILALCCHFSLIHANDGQGAQVGADKKLDELDRAIETIDQLRAQIDRSQFDLGALLERLDHNPEAIIRFVRQEIGFEQYPGSLRGAQGTLMSRSGNALDQAILLASLLKDTGLDARIVQGRISETEAREMLGQMRPRVALPPLADERAFARIVARSGIPAGSTSTAEQITRAIQGKNVDQLQAIQTQYGTAAKRISSRLTEELKRAGKPETWPSKLPVNEAQDYFWVQYRSDASPSWLDVHPAWKNVESTRPVSANATRTFATVIPSTHVQTIEFVLTGERVIGKKREYVTLLQLEPKPAANLIGVPISLTFMPVTRLDSLSDIATGLSNAELFVPLLNGTPSSFVVDLRGYFVPAAEAQSAMAGIFRENARVLSGAASALDNLSRPQTENPATITALTGLWLDIRVRLPDGQVREHRRTIFDNLVGSRRGDNWSIHGASPDQLRGKILGIWNTFIETGHGSTAFKLDESFAHARTQAILEKYRINKEAGRNSSYRPKIPLSAPPAMHFALFDVFDQARSQDRSEISYRSIPSIVTIAFQGNESQDGKVTPRVTVDVITNERRNYVKRGSDALPAADFAIYQGVFETLAEASVLPPEAVTSRNAGQPTLEVMDKHGGFTVLKPDSREAIDNLGLTDLSRRAVEKELDQGYWVIAPSPSGKRNPEDFVWWRVNPTTGNTLGMIHTGQGAAAAEYEMILAHAGLYLTVMVPTCTALYFGTKYGQKSQGIVGSSLPFKLYGACMKTGIGIVSIALAYGVGGFAVLATYTFALSLFWAVVTW